MSRELLGNQTNVTVRFSEVDMMYVVHHSRYWVWFEESKFNFLKKILCISVNDIIESDILMPVVDCSCSYLSSVKWQHDIVVETKLEIINAPYLIFHHTIYDETEPEKRRTLCRGMVKHAFINNNFNMKLKTPSFIAEAIKNNLDSKSFAFIK